MELKNNFVFWSLTESERLHGQIVKIEPLKDAETGQQKISKNGKPVSKIVFRTHDGDVFVRILDTQRVFFEPQLGKRGFICHDYSNNYLTFEEDIDEYEVRHEPMSIEDLFPVEEEDKQVIGLVATLDKVEEYVHEINDLLNNQIDCEDETNWGYLYAVQKANIETAKQILSIRMKGVL